MKTKIALLLVVAGIALAQVSKDRIVYIESKSSSGNLRSGPITFKSETAGGVIGKVKDLTILSSRAILTAAKGKLLADNGYRSAVFDGTVEVKRDRMNAKGPKLTYSETTGVGVLEGGAFMRQTAKDGSGDTVEVGAPTMTFQVDNNISTSEGGVSLKNGNQEGRSSKVYFEEDRQLAIFTDPKEVLLIRKRDGGDLIIRGKEVRSLTEAKRLIALGGVTLTDGEITTTGFALYYDDKSGDAVVVGDRAKGQNAKSVNGKNGSSVVSGVLLHNVNTKSVRQFSKTFKIPSNDFKKLGQ